MLFGGYYNWPPELSIKWIIGIFTGIVWFMAVVMAAARIYHKDPHNL